MGFDTRQIFGSAMLISVKGEPLVSEALADSLCCKAWHGVRTLLPGLR
jgi:hypothetical protein